MKKLLWIAAALVLLVLFPGLAQALAAIVSAAVVWLSTQPILVGFGLGLIAWPHLRRSKNFTTKGASR
ncbi:hypothetical protein OG784_12885 [Streptomyces sp. NBC_01617]|uniref:hypothetical protein n=1 Tax=Streptomyces sp. NBC_01617 TaxID=2975899 RepID=UPI00386CA005|nr:hypothetical protein OG784_12885 [Streptomyces sp. NBC_01617]